MITVDLKNTCLYDKHISLGAKMVSFAGYNMPINYPQGIKYEYNAIRNNVGMFDVSHMGEIKISGYNSILLLQYITVNDISKLDIGDAQYNLICNNHGGIKDDVIIFKIKNEEFLLIVNASNCNKIFNWINEINTFTTKVVNESNLYSLIAVQGPKSREILIKLFDLDINLKFYKHKYINYKNNKILLSRTGYTGELGYEIYGDGKNINEIWEGLHELDVTPCGLAVRDILRMEMKYCLYGNDIDEDINPYEAGLDWVVKINKSNFIGQSILKEKNKAGHIKKLIAFKMIDKSIPRKGYHIYNKNINIGYVTSGTFSIGLEYGIGMGYVNSSIKEKMIFIEVRNKKYLAEIINPPFIKDFSLHK